MCILIGLSAIFNSLATKQVGTVVESVTDYYSGRMTKKEKKATLADELLSDPAVRQYR